MVKRSTPKPGQMCRVFPKRKSRAPFTVVLVAPDASGGWTCIDPVTGEGTIFLSGPRPYSTQLQ